MPAALGVGAPAQLPPTAALRPAARPRRGAAARRPSAPAAARRGGLSEADLYAHAVAPPPAPGGGPASWPWYAKAPAAFAALFVALRVVGALRRRARQSDLAERGFKPGGAASGDAYERAIKGMRRAEYEELSEEEVAAARARRRREAARDGGGAGLDFDGLEIPDNHPFATRREVTPEEEELQRARLAARRGLPPATAEEARRRQAPPQGEA